MNRTLMYFAFFPGFLLLLASFGKTEANKRKAELFFDQISSDNGIWVAENVSYEENNPNSFPVFILEFKKMDTSSLWTKIKGVNKDNDTILFWEIWEFVDILTGKTKTTQRSPAGHYGYGEASFESDKKRTGELTIYFTNGASSMHQSSHELIDEDLLLSKSKNFDTKSNEWVRAPAQEYRRLK